MMIDGWDGLHGVGVERSRVVTSLLMIGVNGDLRGLVYIVGLMATSFLSLPGCSWCPVK